MKTYLSVDLVSGSGSGSVASEYQDSWYMCRSFYLWLSRSGSVK